MLRKESFLLAITFYLLFSIDIARKEIPGCPFRGLLDITSVSLGKYLILQGYALLIVFLLSRVIYSSVGIKWQPTPILLPGKFPGQGA